MASASTPGRPTKPWEHNSSILDGADSSAKLRKVQVILHVEAMARLFEQLEGLTNPDHSPSPSETLIRCWNEALADLSVIRKIHGYNLLLTFLRVIIVTLSIPKVIIMNMKQIF